MEHSKAVAMAISATVGDVCRQRGRAAVHASMAVLELLTDFAERIRTTLEPCELGRNWHWAEPIRDGGGSSRLRAR